MVHYPTTGAPTISGTAQVGETLTADTSGIADEDGLDNATFSYQWLSSRDTAIPGATDSTYTLVSTDLGKIIKVKVTFTDDEGNEESLTSAATAAVADGSNNPATGAPTISGTMQVGQTLTASTSGIADDDGLTNVSYTYQWIANDGTSDSDIQDATLSTYTLVSDDVGKTIKVKVSFSDDAENEETLTSAATGSVVAAPASNTAATGVPTITGTAQVGETLTASTTGISDADGLTNVSYAYQWLTSRDAEISGATSSTYTLVDADEGKVIKVRLTFTDDVGHEESLTSEATAAVAAAPTPLTASSHDVPTDHDGLSVFTFELRFSEEFSLSYKTLRDHAFTVTNGTVTRARRLERPGNIRWEISVRPDGNRDVTVLLPITTDCATQGAICTEGGQDAVQAGGTYRQRTSGCQTQQHRHRRADDQRDGAGRTDADRIHLGHLGQRRADQRDLLLPVAVQQGHRNRRSYRRRTCAGGNRRGQGHQGSGIFHRRQGKPGDAYQRRNWSGGCGSSSSQHPGHGRSHHHRRRPGG